MSDMETRLNYWADVMRSTDQEALENRMTAAATMIDAAGELGRLMFVEAECEANIARAVAAKGEIDRLRARVAELEGEVADLVQFRDQLLADRDVGRAREERLEAERDEALKDLEAWRREWLDGQIVEKGEAGRV